MQSTRTQQQEIALLDADTAASLLDPARRRLLGALRDEPDSAAGLARRLDEPRQRLNYHLREMEKAGLLELAQERRRGNCTERVLRVTARHWLLDPGVLGALGPGPEPAGDRLSAATLVGLASHAAARVARLSRDAGVQGKRLATAAMESRVSLHRPADFEAFVRDLGEAVAGVVARYHDEDAPGGRAFRLLVGAYPAAEEGDDHREDDHERRRP